MVSPLSNWQRRGLGVLSIGGGAIGFGSGMTAVLHGQEIAATNILPLALGMAFFLWGVWCGVQMLEGTRQAMYRNAVFWLVQTPLLQTSILGYTVFCGAQLQVFAKLSPFQIGFFSSGFGAQVALNLGQPDARSAIGVNLVALCISAWLMRKSEISGPALSSVPTK